MKFELYGDINRFMGDTLDILAENEIQNNIVIGNCLKAKTGQDTSKWFLATVKDNSGAVRLTAMMTPPFNLCLYETGNVPDDEVLACFSNELSATDTDIPGVITEKSLAERFSGIFKPEAEKKKTVDMRIYRLDEVNDIPISSGKLRTAAEDDLYFLPYWFIYFTLDCGFGAIDLKDAVEKLRGLLTKEELFVWTDGFPVSMAAVGRKTMNCAVVNEVYTPQYFRGKGYASSCVASLSRHMLEGGYKSCSLFTDLNNPVSNSIYMKMGYKPICDYINISFRKPEV
jgi:predicted GNAT family acetyltransferase